MEKLVDLNKKEALLRYLHNYESKKGILFKREIDYYNQIRFNQNVIPQKINFSEAKTSRDITEWFEPFTARPQNIFYFELDQYKFVGRKSIDSQIKDKSFEEIENCHISASMILGICESEQITEEGILIFFKPLYNAEKVYLFNMLSKNLKTNIYFPYPYLNEHGKEIVCPNEIWDLPEVLANTLNEGENVIRSYTIKFLSSFNLHNKVIYDPACSTGEFLHTIKKHYPIVKTIGQDSSKKMLEYASKKVDVLISGDSLNSSLDDNSADFIFIRFLNSQVVSIKYAYRLLPPIINRCKNHGYIVILGHTPITIALSWLQKLGLEVIQCIGLENNMVFQYYVLKKLQSAPPTSPINTKMELSFEEHVL